MRLFILLPCLVLGLFSPALGSPSREGAPLYLEPGEQRSLGVPGLQRFSVSGDAIRYLRIPNTDRILIKALKPGLSTLLLETSGALHRTHLVRVEAPKSPLLPQDLLRALNRLDDTEVLHFGKQLLLRGNVSRIEEAESIRVLREHFPAWVEDQTRIDERWLEGNLIELNRILETHRSLRIRSGEGMIRIEGSVPDETERELLLRKIRKIQPLTRTLIAAGKEGDPTLHFKVFLLETRKDRGGAIGPDWPTAFHARSPVQPLDLTLRALSEKGWLRILSSPEISLKCPGKAELFAGGEIPIRQRTRFAETVQWKTVGLSLKLEVAEFDGNRVKIQVETEMSHLAQELDRDQVPGLKSNRIRTEVEGFLDRPVLLSGLIQEDFRESARGLPGLLNLPVIGSLFGSREYLDRKSELSAVLLPRRTPPTDAMRSIDPGAPTGWIPPPRDRLDPEALEQAKASPEFPWNLL
jgi:hypothetical protein